MKKKAWKTPSSNKSANLRTFLDDAKPVEYTPTADDLKRKLDLVTKFNVLPELNSYVDGETQYRPDAASQGEVDEAAAKAISRQFTQKALSARLKRSIYDLEEMSQRKTLGERINDYRAKCDMSMQDLADAVQITKKMVNDHINHGAVPKTAILARYVEVFTIRLNQRITVKDLTG